MANGCSDNGGIDEIKYGMFIMPFHDDPSKPLTQCYDEDVELATRLDELGFTELWIGEHHTMVYESVVMPEIFIARVLGETKNIRLGPAPVCLQQHHPAHVASRLAFLDHLSHGRLNLCFGPGSVTTDIELYGLDPKTGSEMTAESTDIILKLWASDPPYHIDGKYWKIHLEKFVDEEVGLGFIPKPLQKPHPPIATPAMSMNSSGMKVAGARGFWPIGHSLVAGNVLADNWKTYSEAAYGANRVPHRSDFRILRAIWLADTTKEAQDKVRNNSLGRNFEYIGKLLDRGLGRKILKRDTDMSDADCNMDYWLEEQIIAGDVDYVLQRLLQMIEETGPFGHLTLCGFDWDDKEAWLRCYDLFANELMPALNKAVLGVAA